MNVNQLNELLARGEVDREDMWPRIVEYESKAEPFLFEFGLRQLPLEPGLIIVRGPRQYGKSTWLDLELRNSARQFGKGSAFYLNGDELLTSDAFYGALIDLSRAFSPQAKARRIFVDEVSAIEDWERAYKRAYDEGALRNVLTVTTGSKATDLRRGAEKLPGRKGRFTPTEYLFLPISYRQFFDRCSQVFGDKTWIAYMLAGGAPLACNDIFQFERIPEYFVELVRDWLQGELVSSGRSRITLQQIFRSLFRFAGTPVGYAKLAREAGLANNTVAQGYIELLSDLMTVIPQWPLDVDKDVVLFRKPAKFAFVNLAAAMAFSPYALRYVHEFENVSPQTQAILLEWLVAQELYRRRALSSVGEAEDLYFWQSKEHEIDFVSTDRKTRRFYEVKRGRAGPLDFSWFHRSHPKADLQVICDTPFEAKRVRGRTIHNFLYDDKQ